MLAGMKIQVKSSGLSLQDLPKQERLKIIDAVAKSKDEFIKTVKMQTPVDTGDLRDSIAAHANKKRTSWLIIAHADDRDTAIKGQAVEHGRGGDTQTGYMQAFRMFLDTTLFYSDRHRRRLSRALSMAAKATVRAGSVNIKKNTMTFHD